MSKVHEIADELWGRFSHPIPIHDAVHCPELMCDVYGWTITKHMDSPDETTVSFWVYEGHCVDMGGAIAFATRIAPEVTDIHTFSGNMGDSRYALRNGKWFCSYAANGLVS